MTREDIICMAKQAGIDSVQQYDSDMSPIELLKRFAALVASAERTACAELCDRFANRMMDAEECADAIRARGQA